VSELPDRGAVHLKLAIVTTHPIQYYAPWFRYLSNQRQLDLRVFFLFEPATAGGYDIGFKREVRWDLPLLEGYTYEFVSNLSGAPGTHHFFGLRNPELTAKVRAFAPDAVLLIGYNYWSLLRFIFAWSARKTPLLLRGDSHRLLPDRSLKARIKALLIRHLFRRFTAFLYVGQANRRYFEMHGVRARKLFFVPHAVENERFGAAAGSVNRAATTWRSELGIGEDVAVAMFAGKFETKKRPLDLLRAFQRLQLGKVALLYVGSGELEQELRDKSRGDANVFFAPFQNQTQMPRAYAACDVLVLPSFGQSETWGLSINEAMCVGKPAIVSTHVGCAEDLIVPGETGLVFEAGNIDALAFSLNHALEDRQRLRVWGEAARERVQRFSYAAGREGLLDALNFAVSQRRE